MVDYARIDISRSGVPLATFENILDANIKFTLGRANKFEITASNEAAEYASPGFIKQGDTADIYMGQDDDYSNIMSGTIYKIDMPEDEIKISGFDWTDFLVGPKATRRYEYQDYAYILRDLIKTYCSQLNTDFILDTGEILEGEYISRYDDLIEVVEDILDTIGYRLIVTTDKKVLIFPKEDTPIILDSFKTDYSSDNSVWTNSNLYWIRDTSNQTMFHDIIDHLYAKGLRKSSDDENLKVKSKIYYIGTGGTERMGVSLKGDDYENCCYGYLDFLNDKLIVGANSPGTLDFLTGGTDSASSTQAPEYFYGSTNVFDDTIESMWISTPSLPGEGGLPAWVKYDLGAGTTKTATKLRFIPYYCISDISAYVKDFELQASNDDVAWTTLTTGVGVNSQVWQEFLFENTTAYRYHRLYVTSDYDPNADVAGVLQMELTETVPISSETDISITPQIWYPLELHLSGSTLTASVGTTQVSTTLSIIPPGTFASLDSDCYTRFDDFGIYSTARHSLTEDDLFEYDITGDLSDIKNRVIVIGGNETKYDGFDSTNTFDRWTIPAASDWTVAGGYLQPTTASYIFGGNQYWGSVDYLADAIFKPDEIYDFFYRRTSTSGDHDDGFYLRVANNTLELICATDGTISSHTLASPPSSGESFKVEILANKNLHEVYFDDIRRIEAEDEHFPKGFIGIYGTTGCQIDLVKCKSDKKIIASAQDTSLYGYGLKEEVLTLPKIRDRTEALSKAALELASKKIQKTSGTLVVPGDYKYSLGDTINLNLPESLTENPKDYLILDVKQRWKDREYLTELKIAEKVSGIEELIRRLRKETRGLAVREIDISDLIGNVADAVTTLSDQVSYTTRDTGTFRFDEAKFEVSDFG